jgi:acyl carrier protein
MDEAQANIKHLVKDEIKQIVSRISCVQAADPRDDVLIREEPGIDSIQAVEILCKCEKGDKVRQRADDRGVFIFTDWCFW